MTLSGLRISVFVPLSECVSGPSQTPALMQLRSDLLHQNIITLCFSGQHGGLNQFSVSRRKEEVIKIFNLALQSLIITVVRNVSHCFLIFRQISSRITVSLAFLYIFFFILSRPRHQRTLLVEQLVW